MALLWHVAFKFKTIKKVYFDFVGGRSVVLNQTDYPTNECYFTKLLGNISSDFTFYNLKHLVVRTTEHLNALKCILIITIPDCAPPVPPVVVYSASVRYNSIGTFSCSNNGTLFYSNGTQLSSAQTTCRATGEWSG